MKLLDAVEQKRIKQKDAALQLGLGERGLRKLLKRYRESGDRAVVHGLRGRGSNRRAPESVRARVVEMAEGEYQGFAPKLLSEYVAEQTGVKLSKETVRQTLLAAGMSCHLNLLDTKSLIL